MAEITSGGGSGGSTDDDDDGSLATLTDNLGTGDGDSTLPAVLLQLAAQIKAAGSFTDLVIDIIIRFVIGVIIGLVLNVAAIIGTVFEIIENAIVAAAGPFDDILATPLRILADTIWAVNLQLTSAVFGGSLGVLAGPVAVALLVAELALLVRLTGPALLAFGELLSAIPIVGGVANAGIVFAVELVGGVGDAG